MADGHHLTLAWRDGPEVTVLAGEGETVLAAAESAGLRLPIGCRTGACASCLGRLLDGDLRYERPPRGLGDRPGGTRDVLCCIARPRADCRIAVGAAILADRASNPWE